MSRVTGILKRESEKARLISVAGVEHWIPRSLTKSITKFMPDEGGYRECVLEVEDWFCEKEDL